MHTIASFAFIGLYCLILLRWSSDIRSGIEPWLSKRLGERSGPERRSTNARAVAEVALVFLATFLPVLTLALAAHFHAISWQLGHLMLIPSLFLPGFAWAAAERTKRERS